LEEKKHCLSSIEILLDSEAPENAANPSYAIAKNSVQYAEHISAVRNYLQSSGLVKFKLPLFEKIKKGIKNLIFQEKINGLSCLQKLWVALGVEALYDILFGFHYYTNVLQRHPVAAIAVNLYQIPAFWLGLP